MMKSQNFRSSFGSSPRPFQIEVDPEFIDYTRQKVALTRFAEDVEQPDFTDGPPAQKAMEVRDYWVKEYNWDSVQTRLNSELQQFTTTVSLPSNLTTFTDAVPLHFVHHASSRLDAIPLLFIHGWPGSFLEVKNIINHLTNPPRDTDPAFHVVAPSIPGFGFSPAPTKPGFSYVEAAHTFDALMKQLKYPKYVIQGGDLGGLILRHQAHLYPESVVSCHSNFWIVPPNAEDLRRYENDESTEDERSTIKIYQGFVNGRWAYGQVQQTTPLRLAHGLTDSPVGLAMWFYHAMHPSVTNPGFWSLEDIITWTMMYWIQGPLGGFRFYKEAAKEGSLNLYGFGAYPFVEQPVSISEFVRDLWYRTPLDWAQRLGNVKTRVVHSTGGHFAATETPELLAKDVRDFFGNEELSNTGVFKLAEHDSLT